MKIIADEHIPFLKGVFEPYFEITYHDPLEITNDSVKHADILITRSRTKCDKTLLKNTRVKFIASATIGHDHIDTEYCLANHIQWASAPGCNAGSVVQYITAAILYVCKIYPRKLSGLTIGIIGAGNIGSRVAEIAEVLGMKVLLNDPPREEKEGKKSFVSLREIQEKADIITFHVPLTLYGKYKTVEMAHAEFFDALKKEPFIINTSRGEIMNKTALKKAYKEHKIKAPVLDVWNHEPDIDQELLGISELGTAHIAGYSADGKAQGTRMVTEAVAKFAGISIPTRDIVPPLPPNPLINVPGPGNNFEHVLHHIIFHTYPIWEDSRRLKKDPRNFENFRKNYPLRREFHVYQIIGIPMENPIYSILKKLGFRMISSPEKSL